MKFSKENSLIKKKILQLFKTMLLNLCLLSDNVQSGCMCNCYYVKNWALFMAYLNEPSSPDIEHKLVLKQLFSESYNQLLTPITNTLSESRIESVYR